MFERLVEYFAEHRWTLNLIASAAMIVVALIMRWTLRQSISVADIPSLELRRRWVLWIRAWTFIVIAAGIGFIWATGLHNVALSIAAFVVALVLSFKELIACITGSFLRVGARAFTLGDRVSVNGVTGDVIDQTLLATVVMEVGPGPVASQYTGRTVTLPNSLFLTNPVTRTQPIGKFAFHTLIIPVKLGDDLEKAEKLLLEACREATGGYINDARAAARRVERVEAIEPPTVEPRVTWTMVDPERVDLVVRYPAPVARRREIEQQILKRYAAHRAAQIKAAAEAAKADANSAGSSANDANP